MMQLTGIKQRKGGLYKAAFFDTQNRSKKSQKTTCLGIGGFEVWKIKKVIYYLKKFCGKLSIFKHSRYNGLLIIL